MSYDSFFQRSNISDAEVRHRAALCMAFFKYKDSGISSAWLLHLWLCIQFTTAELLTAVAAVTLTGFVWREESWLFNTVSMIDNQSVIMKFGWCSKLRQTKQLAIKTQPWRMHFLNKNHLRLSVRQLRAHKPRRTIHLAQVI